jgi:general nucleoside transport system permease protein
VSTLAPPSEAEVARVRPPVGRARVIGGFIAVVGAFTALVFGVGSGAHTRSTLTFTPIDTSHGAPWHLGNLTLATEAWSVVLGVVIVAVGAEVVWRRPQRGAMVRVGVAAILFLLALLLWASRQPGPSQVPFINLTSILVGSAGITMVLIFGSLSGVMCERSGVVNIAIEGQFLGGYLVGEMIVSSTNNWFLATVGGVVIGGLMGWLLAFLAIRYLSDQIIVGVVIVTMFTGLASYFNSWVLTPYPNLNNGNVAPNLGIPLVDKIPILGPTFFNQSGFFYLMIALVALVSFGLFQTRWGLRVRAVGEHPQAAASVGISVERTRYVNVILGGAIAGIGGVAFAAIQGQFTPTITSGFGYIALAAMIFGRWRPSGAVAACALFGISAYLAYNLQSYQVPISTEILLMFPYLITIAVSAGLVGRVRPPAADGIPYSRE